MASLVRSSLVALQTILLLAWSWVVKTASNSCPPPSQVSPFTSGYYPNCTLSQGVFIQCCFTNTSVYLSNGSYPDGSVDSAYMYSNVYPDCKFSNGRYATGCTFPSPVTVLQNGSYPNGTVPMVCQKGTFSSSPTQCQSCHPSCAACVGPADTQCTECRMNTKPLSYPPGLCQCVDNAFLDAPLGGNCILCDPTCSTCTGPSPTECSSCPVGKSLLTDNSCGCLNRTFYNAANTQCEPCDITCGNCNGPSATQCTYCDGENIFLSSSRKCVCLPGYIFNSATRQCVAVTGCHPTCLTCSQASSNTSCLTCKDNAFLNTNGMCVCSKEWFFNTATSQCERCYSRCQTCLDATNCLTCKSGLYMDTETQECICPIGTIGKINGNDTSSYICVPCENKLCRTCDPTNSSVCTSCKANMMISPTNTSTCVCSLGFVFDADACVRPNCSGLCTLCNGPSRYQCTACVANAMVVNRQPTTGDGECQCIDGFYNATSSTCEPCDGTCLRCNGNLRTQCTLCRNNSFLNSSNGQSICQCNDGFFMDDTTGICIACHSSCATCTDSTKQCLTCKPGTERDTQTGICGCQPNQFMNTYGQCVNCHPTCKTCYGSLDTNCLSCNSSAILNPAINKCTCDSLSKYLTANGGCEQCHESCESCSINSTNCTLCRYPSVAPAGGGLCTCPSQYQKIGEGSCSSCHTNCLTCNSNDGSNINCRACKVGTVPDPITRECPTAPGSFDRYGRLLTCSSNCTKCATEGPLGCLPTLNNCKYGLVYKMSYGNCQCRPGFYWSEGTGCLPCNIMCRTCSGPSATECTSCKTNALLDNYKSCKCAHKNYLDPSTNSCAPCHPNCYECAGPGQLQCTQCIPNTNPVVQADGNYQCMCNGSPHVSYDSGGNCLIGKNINDKNCFKWDVIPLLNVYYCVEPCREGGVYDGSTKRCACKFLSDYSKGTDEGFNCVPCHYSCVTCDNLDYKKCRQCSPGRDPVTCECLPGSYSNDLTRKCERCHPSCNMCNDASEYSCLTCVDSINAIIIDGQCICPPSMYMNTSFYCIDCDNKCETCAGNSTSCRSCKINAFLRGDVCTCVPGYSFDSNGDCVPSPCHYSCEKCMGSLPTDCYVCKTGLVLIDGRCTCPQQSQYVNIKGSCSPCPGICGTCVNSTTCDRCGINAKRGTAGTGPGCICEDGYYSEDGYSPCIKIDCDPSCIACKIVDRFIKCMLCKDDFELDPINNLSCILKPYKYLAQLNSSSVPLPCHPTCYGCFNSSKLSCKVCAQNLTLTIASGSVSFCSCPTGTYADNQGNCNPCYSNCAKCINGNPSGCLECKENSIAVPAPSFSGFTNYFCPCKPGYEFENGICRLPTCHVTCLKCNGIKDNDCTECRQNAKLVNNSCVCYRGYSMNPSGYCVQCHPTCDSCFNLSEYGCTTCKDGSKLLSNQKCVCELGFKRMSDGSCVSHQSDKSCLSFSGPSKYNCLSCVDQASLLPDQSCSPNYGYYMDSNGNTGICFPTCGTCKGKLFNDCTSCKQMAELNTDGTCSCGVGMTFDSYGNCIKIPCHASCQECDGFNSNACLKCKGQAYLNAFKQCICPSGLYMTPGGDCQECSSTCITCTGPSTSDCTSCQENSIVSAGVCTPLPGFFVNQTTGVVKKCYPSCSMCNGPLIENCLRCVDGAVQYADGSCICQYGLFLDHDSGKCISPDCSTNCLNCLPETPNTCTSCRVGSDLSIAQGSCVCQPGFVLNSQGQCIVPSCHKTCNTCWSGLLTHCTSCKDKAFLDGSNIGPCLCSKGTFMSSDGNCMTCHPTCETCTNGEYNGCVTCKPNSSKQLDGSCMCNRNFFLSSTSRSCEPCHFTCMDCTGPFAADCINCKIPALKSTTGYCACPDGFSMRFDGYCTYPGCHPTCAACKGPLDNDCTSCDTDSDLIQGKCICKSGLNRLANFTCVNCDISCATCNGTRSTNSCTSCRLKASLVNVTNGLGTCVCDSEYFMDPITGKCLPCHYSCKECNGESDSECTKCRDIGGKALQPTGNKCICDSPYKMYTDGYCKTCPASCDTCDSQSRCASCRSNAIWNENRICICKPGYFMDFFYNCVPCHPECPSCFGDKPDQCLTCPAGKILVGNSCKCPPGTYTVLGQCRTCTDGNFFNSIANSCAPCATPNCAICDSEFQCSKCSIGYRLNITGECSIILSTSGQPVVTAPTVNGTTSQQSIPVIVRVGNQTFFRNPFNYRIELLHDQLFVYTDTGLTKQDNSLYLESILSDSLLSITKNDRSSVSDFLTWKVLENSKYEWERGILRFRLIFSRSSEGFISLMEVRPPRLPYSLSYKSASQNRLLSTTTEESRGPKELVIPTYTTTSEAARKAWFGGFSILYILTILMMIFLVLIRPFNKSLRDSVTSFWFAQNIMWFQLIFLFGFLAVDFRGYLDQVLLNLSASSLSYFGSDIEFSFLSNLDHIKNSYYVGKYTASGKTHYLYQKMCIPMVAYLSTWVISALPLGSIKEMIIAIRSGIGISYATQFCFLAAVNFVSFFGAQVYTRYTVTGMIFCIITILLLWFEISLMKLQLFKDKTPYRLFVTKNKGMIFFDASHKEDKLGRRIYKKVPLMEIDCILASAIIIGALGKAQMAQPIILSILAALTILSICLTKQRFKTLKLILGCFYTVTVLLLFIFYYMKANISVESINFMIAIFLIFFFTTLALNLLITVLRVVKILKRKMPKPLEFLEQAGSEQDQGTKYIPASEDSIADLNTLRRGAGGSPLDNESSPPTAKKLTSADSNSPHSLPILTPVLSGNSIGNSQENFPFSPEPGSAEIPFVKKRSEDPTQRIARTVIDVSIFEVNPRDNSQQLSQPHPLKQNPYKV
jgi:hypothetical protein